LVEGLVRFAYRFLEIPVKLLLANSPLQHILIRKGLVQPGRIQDPKIERKVLVEVAIRSPAAVDAALPYRSHGPGNAGYREQAPEILAGCQAREPNMEEAHLHLLAPCLNCPEYFRHGGSYLFRRALAEDFGVPPIVLLFMKSRNA
jgi:hypothetical protein